ncbi:shikimate kinase [Streptococcus fryi]
MARLIIGFMGAGKTSLAKGLAANYLDMDIILEHRFGMSLSDYFANKGEDSFRQEEHLLLKELIPQNMVIATGGGIVTLAENRQLLRQADEVIYLKADFETLYDRLVKDKGSHRPLFQLKSKEELEKLYQRRQLWYEEVATKIIDVSTLTPEEVLDYYKESSL